MGNHNIHHGTLFRYIAGRQRWVCMPVSTHRNNDTAWAPQRSAYVFKTFAFCSTEKLFQCLLEGLHFVHSSLVFSMIIWLQSSPRRRCPSGHQKRRSSCVGHLSGIVPVFTHTINVTNVHQYQCGTAANSFSELRTGGCSFLWYLWLMGEGQRKTMCELQPVSSCKKMARQPGFSPPLPPCGCEGLPSQHCIYHIHMLH